MKALTPFVLPDPLPQTPFYLYDQRRLETLWHGFKDHVLGPDIFLHFACKANNNPTLLKFFLDRGAGLDVVSGGELAHGLKVGFETSNIVFSGVGKSDEELRQAVESNCGLINLESRSELQRLSKISRSLNKNAIVGIRVNPDVDPKTHPYIATGLEEHKFGVDFEEARSLFHELKTLPSLQLKSLSIHIGSQLLDLSPIDVAIKKTLALYPELYSLGLKPTAIDVGGGLGVPYTQPDQCPDFETYGRILRSGLSELKRIVGPGATLHSECGRALIAQSSCIVTRVVTLKKSKRKKFVIVDASMSELLRPSLYQAHHEIVSCQANPTNLDIFDVAGPVCESADVLGRDRTLAADIKEGDLVRIETTGAYGRVMSNTYNMRPLPSEYFIDGHGTAHCI